jgi:phosphoglycerol transferase
MSFSSHRLGFRKLAAAMTGVGLPGERAPRLVIATVYCTTALLTVLIFFHLHALWGKDLRVPITSPRADYGSQALFAKTVMETGWCGTNARLGAPYTFECYDFPLAEGLTFTFFAAFGRFSNDVTLGINIFYILSYVLISTISLFVFRQFGLATLPSIPASLLYSFLPYHYLRAEYHLFLSAYYVLPLMVLLLAWIHAGECFIKASTRRGLPCHLTRKGVAALVICFLMGSGGIYYAAFALIFLLVTGIIVVLRTQRATSLIVPGLAGFLILSAVLINLAPNLWFFHVHGEDQAVAHRRPQAAEIFGLKITNLLLPIPNHRAPRLANLRSSYWSQTGPAGEYKEPLGLVIGAGFLILIVTLFSATAGGPSSLLGLFRSLNIAAVLVATVGGFGSLFNFLVFPEIRVYARIAVYIAFFSLGALLVVIRTIQVRFAPTTTKALLFNLGAAGIIFAGLWDLTPANSLFRPEIAPAYRSDRDFVSTIEATMPRGAMIFQLPYLFFPEHGPLNRMTDYEPATGYLYSNSLRWSYGAMNGRAVSDWQQHEANLPPPELLASLKLIGFQGLWIDTFGYKDGAAALSGQVRDLLQREPLRSANGRYLFYSLASYRPPDAAGLTAGEQMRQRDAALSLPLEAAFRQCSILETDGRINWRWCGKAGEIDISNDNPRTVRATLTMSLRTASPVASNFSLHGDFGTSDLRADVRGTEFVKTLEIPPGIHVLRIDSDAPRVDAPRDVRVMHFRIVNFQLKPQ